MDKKGNIFRCREGNGEYLLEEQIVFADESPKMKEEIQIKKPVVENIKVEWEEIVIEEPQVKGKLHILRKKVLLYCSFLLLILFY